MIPKKYKTEYKGKKVVEVQLESIQEIKYEVYFRTDEREISTHLHFKSLMIQQCSISTVSISRNIFMVLQQHLSWTAISNQHTIATNH